MLPPSLGAGGAAFVAVQQGRDIGGQQIAVGVCGCGVHGAGAVVVGQDHSEVVGGAPRGCHMNRSKDLFSVGLTGFEPATT